MAGQPCRHSCVARLDQRVFDECSAGFVSIVDAEFTLRDDLYIEVRENALDLTQLAGITCWPGQFSSAAAKTHPPAEASASSCALMIVSIPIFARPSIVESSSSLNACPSAVPWISTNRPASFMTTFISVSACESSS